jgi:hypothetical protein
MPRRTEKRARMSGLLDIFDVFGPKPEKKRELPGLPAPKEQLPSVREERLPAQKKKESLKEQLLSIFDVFGPRKEEMLPAERVEKKESPKEAPWEMMFEPSAEEKPIFEVYQPEEKPKYKFVHSGIARIPYEAENWNFPSSPEEMASYISGRLDVQAIFRELGESRETPGYQDLLAEYAFRGLPLYTPIIEIDPRNYYTDFAEFYSIPWSIVERYPEEIFRKEIVQPLNMFLSEAFEIMKPEYLPGFFTVDMDGETGKHWLYYVEPWLGRLPGA